jgi:hypothetical protein
MVCLCALALAGGCENAGQGAVSGGAVGALSGLAIGSLSGNAGAGAAIGAVTGAVGGAVIGDQNRRNKEAAEAAAAQNAAAQSKPPRVYVTGGPLWLLVGNWNVQGEELATDGTRVPITGSVKGVVDKTYFLRLDCRFNNPRGDGFVEGTSVISQDGGDRLSMSNSFSSSPQMVRYTGNVDKSGLLFTFTQYEPRSDSPRKVTLRIISNDRISAEVWQRINGKDQRVESYTFTRAA